MASGLCTTYPQHTAWPKCVCGMNECSWSRWAVDAGSVLMLKSVATATPMPLSTTNINTECFSFSTFNNPLRQVLLPFDRGSESLGNLPRSRGSDPCLRDRWWTYGQLLCLDMGISGQRLKPYRLVAGEDAECCVTEAQGWSLPMTLTWCQAPGLPSLRWSLTGSMSHFFQLVEVLGSLLLGASLQSQLLPCDKHSDPTALLPMLCL